MRFHLAVIFASVYGLSIRIMFGFMNELMGIMSISFLVLLPIFIGFLTVILIPKEKKVGAIAAFFIPWITSVVVLITTVVLNIEGTICWIIIFPLFACLSGLGGCIAYNIRVRRELKEKESQRLGTLKVSLILLFPLFLGMLEGDRTLTTQELTISRAVTINASSTEVWKVLTTIDKIKMEEKSSSFLTVLGFPEHISTTIDTLAVGGKRIALYEKGLYFEEEITKYNPNHLMVLKIKTDPSKIPPSVMDEHILIGGKHVDILEDIYTLETLPNGQVRLGLSSRFIINTPFNWYAKIWSNFLMADILQGELDLVKNRAASK